MARRSQARQIGTHRPRHLLDPTSKEGLGLQDTERAIPPDTQSCEPSTAATDGCQSGGHGGEAGMMTTTVSSTERRPIGEAGHVPPFYVPAPDRVGRILTGIVAGSLLGGVLGGAVGAVTLAAVGAVAGRVSTTSTPRS